MTTERRIGERRKLPQDQAWVHNLRTVVERREICITPINHGNAAFNCTHPLGVGNCPIHSVNPDAPLMDCRYETAVLTDGKSVWMENKETFADMFEALPDMNKGR